PSASNLGANARPSSTSSVEPGGAKTKESSDTRTYPAECKIIHLPSRRRTGMRRLGARSQTRCLPPSFETRAADAPQDEGRKCARSPPVAHHCDEGDLVVRVAPEAAGELRRDGRGAGLLDAAQRHAHVLGFQHHRHAAWPQNFLECGCDLRSHM